MGDYLYVHLQLWLIDEEEADVSILVCTRLIIHAGLNRDNFLFSIQLEERLIGLIFSY